MPAIMLDAIALDEDLIWSDEYQWSPVARTSEYTLTGAMVYEESIKQVGRPITIECKPESQSELAGTRNLIWMKRSTVDALYAKLATPGLEMTLTLSDSRTFQVVFRDQGFEARPVIHVSPHANTDPYYLSLYLMTV